nr:MAG TPA: hypothetical protein [Caudoviricetes sp.]
MIIEMKVTIIHVPFWCLVFPPHFFLFGRIVTLSPTPF